MKDSIQDLVKSLKSTAGSRFNAAKRLESLDRKLTYLIASASAYVICLTILPYFVQLPKQVADTLNLITVFFSIVILATSLLQYSSNNTVKAEQFHRSALEINELLRELSLKAATIKDDDFLKISEKYNVVLQKYSINHHDLDYELYQLQRPHDHAWIKWKKRIALIIKQWFSQNVPNAILIFSTGLFLWLVFGYALRLKVV